MSETTMPGVAFTPPPLDLQPQISRAIADAVRTLPEGSNGALVALANEQGANAAIVARVDTGYGWKWETQAWVGKTWKAGAVQYGGSVRASW
jgi:hypothetical protein